MVERYPYFPQFDTYLPTDYTPGESTFRPGPAETPATGTGNWLTSGLAAGGYGAVSEFGRALQAAAQFVGAPGAAQSIGDFAQRMHEAERSYARPDLEESPWSLPGIGYQIARMAPQAIAALGGAAVGAAVAPEAAVGGAAAGGAGLLARIAGPRLLGAAAATLPFTAGENVQRQISETGQLTTPGKALALGVPEAYVQAILPGKLEKYFGEGIVKGVAHAAATQGFAGGATEFLTQQLGDPNRGFADRASAVVHNALSGAALGTIIGGGYRALAGKPTAQVLNDPKAQADVVDQAINPPPPPPAPPAQGQLPLTGGGVRGGQPQGELPFQEARQPPAGRQLGLFGEPGVQTDLFQPEGPAPRESVEPAPAVPEPTRQITYQPGVVPLEMRGPLQDIPTGELYGRMDVLSPVMEGRRQPPRTQAEAEELRQLHQEAMRRAVDEITTPTPEPQKLLEPPSTKETMPLQDMNPTDLMDRFHFVESWLKTNPGDVRAQRASEVLAQEFSRRAEVAKKAEPPAAEAPAAPPAAEAPAAPPAAEAPAAPAPVLNFTARLTEGAFKKGVAAFKAATEDQQADIRSSFIDTVLARGGKALTGPLKKWGKALDVLTEDGKELREEFIPERAPEAPPGVTEEAPPEVLHDVTPQAPAPELPVEPAPPPAAVTPIKTAEDRAATLDNVASHIEILPPSPAKDKLTAEAQTVMKLLPNVETNPGLALSLNIRLTRLRNQVEAAAQRPADAVASPDLTPSPTAEAKPAMAGDLGTRLEDAQSALSDLRKVLPSAKAEIAHYGKWLAEVTKAGPEESAAVLAKDPEALAAKDETGTLPDLGGMEGLNPTQAKKMDAYLTAHKRVVQELEAQGGPESRTRVISSRDGLPVTQLDADVTDLHQRGVPLADVAKHIMEHTPDAETAEIVGKLLPFLPKDGKTVFRDGVTDKEGEYFTKSKTSALYNAANAAVTSVHEMVHAVMHRALEGDSAAATAMRGIYDQLKDTGNHAGITDAHEMVSEALANPVYRAFLKSQMVRGTSLWDRMIDTVRGFIGLEPRLFNAFDRIMSHGDDLMKEQRAYPNEWLGPDSYARVANDGTGTAAAAADEADRSLSEKLFGGSLNVRNFVRGVVNGWSPGQWLARNPVFNKLSPNIQAHVDALSAEDPRKKQIGKAAIVADRQSKALPAEGQESLKQGMAMTTSYGFHPDQGIGQYIDDIKDNPTRMRQFQAVENWWSEAGNIPGVREAYNTWRSAMSMLGHMTAVHNLQSVERSIPGLVADDAFKRFDVRGDLTNQPKQGAAFWQKELNDRIATNKEFSKGLATQKAAIDTQLDAIKFKKDQPKELVKQSAELGSAIDQLNAAVKLAEGEQKRMLKEPYFHLGRKGDFFATGKLVTQPGAIDEETGKPGKPVVNQDVLSKFADHLQKNGINDVAIMEGNQHGTFYTRVETPAQLAALEKVMRDAQKLGLLATDPLSMGKIFDPHIFNRVATQATQDVIERLRANRPVAPVNADPSLQPALDKAHYAQVQDLQRTLLSMTPETSMNRLMAHRQNVQGFSKDMLASQGYAADVTAFSLARRTLAHEVSAAEAGMLKDVEKANETDIPLNTKLGLADTVGELMHGQRIRQTYVPKDWRDMARQFTNFLHIGMAPAYFPMQISQLAITGAPELAKLQGSGLAGYGRAFMAMQRAVGPTMRAIAATVRSPDGLTAGITPEALAKAGMDPTTINKIMGMELRGSLGTYTASVSEHPALTGTMLKAANTLGMYSDLVPRLITGLAADELYTAKPHPTLTREQFIDRAIGDSQGYYSAALAARQMGRGGFLGPYTPMTMQFQTWNINLANKIYREVHDAFKGEDAQTKKDARTWLAGHAAAVTMLSGTLGLPAVSVAASVYDKLADWFTNRDDHDITASYRNFLAHTFGKDMGEIIARGLPRKAGLDFANWGEGEIIPGTASLKIFTEKRKWEDVEKDWFKSMGGPALDQVLQFGLAARDITNGDYLEGLGRVAPGLVAGPLKAYRLGAHGFVDQYGQPLPLSSPNAAQIVLTALGLKPAGQAEYQEVAREVSGLRAMREASSANISQHLRQAWTQGDTGSFQAWMAEAQRWQIQHPGFLPPQAHFGQALNTHMQQLAQAKGMGLPIGVRPQDIGPRGALEYANIPVQ